VVDDRSKFAEPKDPRVEAALREYLERVDRGEPVDREEFLARHALIADQVRSFISAQDEVTRLAGSDPVSERSRDSTRSFVGYGQETIAPKSVAKQPAEKERTGLAGQFGRYRIIRALGKGAMGTVYLAEDTQLERPVAIKTPHFTESPSEDSLERFYREARTAGTLRHPNICPIHDVGQIDGKHYISMAYIEGRPLSAYIQPDKPQTERQILIVVRKLALALQEAHDDGIVHRDLKPANIMIDKKGEPIIMDFGLARQTRREGDIRLTQTGDIIGTPAYMSPEQVEGEPDRIGHQTDQYSLGVILYELLTTKLPFRGSVIAVMGQILTKEVTPPSQMRPDLDSRIESVCLKMMAKNSSERFGSLKAVADELATILKSPAPKAATKDKPASAKAPPPTGDRIRADVRTSQVLKSLKQKVVTDSDLASLEELARKCYSRRDFEQVIQIIERVPEERRNAGSQALLEKSRGKADEIAFLICEIDEAVRLNDRQAVLKKAEELLKIKPGHHRALKVQADFAGYGEGGTARIGILDQFRRPLNDGGWIPWSVLAFGLAVFGVMTGVIVIYLNKTAVLIDIQDPGVEVAVKGTPLTVTGPDQQSVKVVPGDHDLTISCAGLVTVTKSFTIKRGEKRSVTVSIINKEIVARLDNEIARLPPAPVPVDQLLVAPFDEATAHKGQEAWASHFKTPVQLINSIGMKLTLIPPGEFQMGSPDYERERSGIEQQHRVRITKPFYLGVYEVTQSEFEHVMGRNPSEFLKSGGRTEPATGFDTSRNPVENVTWYDAVEFCNELSKKEGRRPHYHIARVQRETDGRIKEAIVSIAGEGGYRLPTEAQWEYACRAGTTTPFSFGSVNNGRECNCNGKVPYGRAEPGPALRRTAPVGSYPPNGFGLYDMHGNVWEVCWDVLDTGYYKNSPESDPMGPSGGHYRVMRGGGWYDVARLCRSAIRGRGITPVHRNSDKGFRIALSITDEERTLLLVAPFDEATAKKGQETWAGHLDTGVHLSNAIGMKLVLIPPGEFQMGSTNPRLPDDVRPVHRVRITKPFFMGIYEATQEEYQRIMGSNPSHFHDDPRLPVESISGQNILDFCRKLSEMPEEKQAGRTYRLPTEAEWEYACRAGTTTRFHFGDVMSSDQANFDGDNPGLDLPRGPNLGRTTKVGSYRPNAFGLYDMHGNVIEVISDSYSADYYSTSPVDDPQGPTSGDWGIARGGGWSNPAVPSAYRYSGPKSTIDPGLGFRVVCDFGSGRAE
jgi:formylglycine-generating enzyme required for sulfatase activity/serine/threonine protein kinase